MGEVEEREKESERGGKERGEKVMDKPLWKEREEF